MSNISKIFIVAFGYISFFPSQGVACTDIGQRFDLSNNHSHYAPQQRVYQMSDEIDLSSYEQPISQFLTDLKQKCHKDAVEIDISNNSLGDDILKEISNYPNFQNIYLNDNCFTDVGAVYLSQFKNAREIDLSNNYITSNGIRFLPLENIEILQVNFLNLKNEGLEIISAAPKINHLNICGAGLDDSAVPLLVKMKNLKILSISYNNFTQEAVDKLLRELPLTTIVAQYMHS